MADNVTFQTSTAATPPSGTKVATDEDGSSAHHQYVKLEFGGDGTFTKVSSTDPLPVTNTTWGLSTDTAATGDGTGNNTAMSVLKRISDLLYSDQADSTLKYALITASSSGDTTVVSGVTGKKLRVMSAQFTLTGADSVTWKSGSGTTISSRQYMSIGAVLPWNPGGWFETGSASALVLNLATTGVTAAGTLTYYEI